MIGRVFQYGLTAVLLLGAGFLFYTQAVPFFTPPCTVPITYSIESIDPRFGIATSTLTKALTDAESLWNAQAEKPLVTLVPSGGDVSVQLVYGEVQETAELGDRISVEQEAYNAKKAQIDALRSTFASLERAHEQKAAAYEEDLTAYQESVAYWNAQGGAPEKEYKELSQTQERLESKRLALNEQVEAINDTAEQINGYVQELNAFGEKINSKVNSYNAHADTDFDQGEYVQDASGKRITIYEYADGTDLRRVLAHELGHALALGHVEGPESIMYAYNFGSEVKLSEEDIAELRMVCKWN